MPPLKFLENIVILCFERPFSKQNSVIRLESNIVPPLNFWATGTILSILLLISCLLTVLIVHFVTDRLWKEWYCSQATTSA